MKRIKKITIQQIIEFLGKDLLQVHGETKGVFIDHLADVENTNETTLDWINHSKVNKQQMTEQSKAQTVLVDASIEYSAILQDKKKVLLVVENPRLIISKVISVFFIDKKSSFIHPSAVIDSEAQIDETAFIDAGCVIGKAKIGKNTVLRANVCIYDDVTIGDNCLIQAGTVIGTDGLGCGREDDGTLVKFPHLGGVSIGDNVEIGANCQIAKGVFGNTIIGDGCKINGLCFIAHNCKLEKNVWITGSTMLSGSVSVGKNTTIFSNVVIRDQTKIGENTIIGMGAVVTKHIPAGETWLGSPARKLEKK